MSAPRAFSTRPRARAEVLVGGRERLAVYLKGLALPVFSRLIRRAKVT
jgi:hypothetical protein